MRRIALFMGAITGLLFFSCTKEEFSPISEDQEGAEGAVMEVTCSIPDYEFVDTKATIAQSGSFTWSTGDQMSMWPSVSAVYSGTPQAVIFKVKQGGSKTATLVGNGWGLLRGQKYYASFPYNSSNTYSKVSINYAGLNQVSNGSTSHLGARDYQHAVTTVPAQGNASVNFSRISSIVKFVITVPENRANVKYTKLTLSSEENLFSNSATYNPSADEVVLSSTKVNQISMTLNGTTGFTPTDGVLTLYVIMAPAAWAGKNIQLSLRDEYNYSYSGSFTPSKNQSSGSAGTLPLSVELQSAISLPYELVDMGLSVLWTTANYGADTPTQYGTYLDGEDDIYDEDLIDDLSDTYGNTVSYNVPTRTQFDELVNNCIITTTTLDGVKVQKFTSKKNNAVLYLPAAGYITYYSTRREVGIGTEFAYWTSSSRSPHDLYYYDGDGTNSIMYDVDDDCVSMPVRLIWSGDSPALDVLTGLALDPTSLKIEEGGQATINAIVSPSDARNKKVNWTSSDANVATVDENGIVSGVNIGNATITAKTVNGGYTATCEVTVVEPSRPYLTFTSAGNSSLSLKKQGTPNDVTLEYRIGDGEWDTYTIDSNINLANNQSVSFRASKAGNSAFSKSTSDYYKFENGGSGTIAASGNVMSLIDQTCTTTTIPNQYCFYSLFYNCTSLTSAPELPAEILKANCYQWMFHNTSIKTAPMLPAPIMADFCYYAMFDNCSLLVQAPQLSSTSLAESCYAGMFRDCSSLLRAPSLPSETLAPICYGAMFKRCTSLKQAPELPALTMTYYCYGEMFQQCTSLVNAPELPATILNESCYEDMFLGCSNLTSVPDLPANTLSRNSYHRMFQDCTSLKVAPNIEATNLAFGCCTNMFAGCSSLEIGPTLRAVELVQSCYSGMFEGCSSLKHVQALFTTDPSTGYYTTWWMHGVSQSGTFVKNPDATWIVRGDAGIPEGWTEQLSYRKSNGHQYVDLGLPSGLKWATCNIGASKPEEYGDYFAWGEVYPHYTKLSPLTWKSSYTDGYSWSNYKYCNGTSTSLTKYCWGSYTTSPDYKKQLELEDDAANVNWNGTWRMPTKDEFNELLSNCRLIWVNINGINGYRIISKINHNDIFLPAAGCFNETSDSRKNSYGYYWTSTIYNWPQSAYRLLINSNTYENGSDMSRIYGISVRPVTE